MGFSFRRLPINDTNQPKGEYKGQEYLTLYPYVTEENDNYKKMRLWINESLEKYVDFEAWLLGRQPFIH